MTSSTTRLLVLALAAGCAAGALGGLGTTGCAKTEAPAQTGLMIEISTDLASTRYDALRVQVSQESSADSGVWHKWVDESRSVPKEVPLPASVFIQSGSAPDQDALVQVALLDNGQPIVVREAQVQLPTNRVAELVIVLAERCVGPTPGSLCPAGYTCEATGPMCTSIVIDPSTLPTYEPGQVQNPTPASEVDATTEGGGSIPDAGAGSPPDSTVAIEADGSIDGATGSSDGSMSGSNDGSPGAAHDSGSDAGSGPPPPPPCNPACTAPLSCCNGHCVNTAKDLANCGACGLTCTASQFCTGLGCDETIISNVCANPTSTVVFGSYDGDDEAGAVMGAALTALCVPSIHVVSVSQDAPGILEAGSGRPITGPGDTFVTAGDGYLQNGVKHGEDGVIYMEQSTTPLYVWGDGTNGEIRNRAGNPLVTTPVKNLTAHHDYFYLQVTVEPQSGTLCFSGVGMAQYGTNAMGYFVANQLLPNLSSFTKTWYVYAWDDTNNDSTPNGGDTYSLLQSGP
jgi:Stigma-specific protein, Stig1